MAKKSFLKEFDAEYAKKLKVRADTFRRAFELLEATNKTQYTIVETGCARTDGNWDGDGQSTMLFDRFVNHWDGRVLTVDISEEACTRLRSRVSPKVSVTCSDSVAYLAQLARARDLHIDLLYLDSYDLDWSDPHPAALHHMHELCAILPTLASGALVLVDHTARTQSMVSLKAGSWIVHDNGLSGKGVYVAEYFSKIGCVPAIEGYQYGWIMP